MSSSQSDELEQETQKVRKPRKLKVKFLQLLNSQQQEDQKEPSSNSQIHSTFYQKEQTKFQKHRNSKQGYNKFDRRLPIAITILTKFVNKNVKFNTDQEIEQLENSCQKKSKSKNDKSKVCFSKMTSFEQELQNEKDNRQLTEKISLSQITNQSKSITTRTRNTTLKKKTSKGSTSKLKEATTPIFGKTRKTHEIKQTKRNGNKIRATWYLGRINGYAEVDYYDGAKFKGIFQGGQIVSGELNFGQGYIYTGQFTNFKFHGKGKFLFPQGHYFLGEWAYGNLIGKTTIKYPEGQVYYGQVVDYKRHGQGYLYMNNHEKYFGQFFYGDLTGFGEFYYDGILKKKGYWIKGKYIGCNQQQFKSINKQVKQNEKRQRRISNQNSNFQKRRISMFIPTQSIAFIRYNNFQEQSKETSSGESLSFRRIQSFS